MAQLSRRLNFFDGATLLVGSVIGSGIFVTTGEVAPIPIAISAKVPSTWIRGLGLGPAGGCVALNCFHKVIMGGFQNVEPD